MISYYTQFELFLIISMGATDFTQYVNFTKTLKLNHNLRKYIKFDSNLVYYWLNGYGRYLLWN